MSADTHNRLLQEILARENLNITSNPRGTDKGDKKSYVDKFYEKHFASYRDKPISLLEIGFRHGASLALWSSFFHRGRILGVDNLSDPAITGSPALKEWLKRPNVRIALGDAYSKAFADGITEAFDIIIDDGPHTLASQRAALELYLPKLRAGGMLIVEDLLLGGVAILPLLSKVPSRYACSFYDYRWHRRSGDNCLFVVQNIRQSVTHRAGLALLGVLYGCIEGPIRLLKRLTR